MDFIKPIIEIISGIVSSILLPLISIFLFYDSRKRKEEATASKEEAQAKWEELGLNYNGTVIYHPDSDWENLENNDNATDALPDAMKGLLALTERLG